MIYQDTEYEQVSQMYYQPTGGLIAVITLWQSAEKKIWTYRIPFCQDEETLPFKDQHQLLVECTYDIVIYEYIARMIGKEQ